MTATEPHVTAYIGMGGNVGDVAAAMRQAVVAIAASPDCSIVALSPVYRTPPWGMTDQPPFLNCCFAVETRLAPRALLVLLKAHEAEAGRQKTVRWGPRPIDLDILLFGDTRLDEPGLVIPHPRMTERAFVMVPLADMAPDLVVDGKSARQWAHSLPRDGMEKLDIRLWPVASVD